MKDYHVNIPEVRKLTLWERVKYTAIATYGAWKVSGMSDTHDVEVLIRAEPLPKD